MADQIKIPELSASSFTDVMKNPKIMNALALLGKVKSAGASASYSHYYALCKASGIPQGEMLSEEEFDKDKTAASRDLPIKILQAAVPEDLGITHDQLNEIINGIKQGGGTKAVVPHVIGVVGKVMNVPEEYLNLVTTLLL